ncbi:MAG: hypothetical protein ACFB0C_20830, partial [Leptolyngbyaceae cyanobacterium]
VGSSDLHGYVPFSSQWRWPWGYEGWAVVMGVRKKQRTHQGDRAWWAKGGGQWGGVLAWSRG